jgi:hypothetical protein
MSSSEFKIDLKFFSTGIDEVINGFSKLKTAMDSANTGTTTLAKSTESLGQKTEKEKPSLLQLGTAFGTVTAAGWSLYNSYDNLEKIKAASAKADVTAQKAAMAVTAAQKAYNDAIAKSGAGSKDATDAALKLAVAKENLVNKMEMAEIKAGDVSEAYAQFATTLPTMVLSVVNAGLSFNKMVKEMGGIHKIAPQVTSALQAVGGGFKAILMNPIGLVLTAIATVFVLLATNAFGFRDAVNGLGKAIGDALPWLKDFLNLIGGAANWFLNLINPVGEASAQLDTLGTSATAAGTAMEETQVQVEGLGGALVNEGDVIQDVMGFTDDLIAKEAEVQTAYEAYKTARLTGNTELIDSYNLTGEEVTKFKEQYEKDMEDAQKAAEDAAEKSYEAWKKSRDDINNAMKEGFGVLSSYFDKIINELVTAAGEGMDDFEDVMEEHGIDWGHPAVQEAIIKFIVDSEAGEQELDTFVEFVFRNVQGINTATTGEFAAMMGAWAAEIADEKPEFATKAYDIADAMTTSFNNYMNTGKYSPGQAFLASVKDNLSEDEAKTIGAFFPGVILDTTAATFQADTKVPAAVDSLTAKIDAALGIGLSKLPTTTGTEVGKIGPAITSQSPTIERDASSLTEGVNSIFQTDFAEIPKITDTEFQKVPQAITTSGNKANTESQSMATKVTTNVKKIGTEATATSDIVTKEFGTTIPNAAAKMVTDSKPEMDTMVSNTKTFATNMKTELSPIAALFKQILPNVPQGGSMQTSPSPNYEKIQNATLSPEFLKQLGVSEEEANASGAFGTFVNQPVTQNAELGQAPLGMTEAQIKALNQAWSTLSTSVATYTKSIGTNITNLQKIFSTFSTSVSTYANSMKTNLGAFFTAVGTAFGLLDQAIKGHQTTWSTFSTSLSTYANSMKTNLGAFFTAIGAAFGLLDQAIKGHQTTWSTFSTSISTYAASMKTNLGAFFTAVGTAFGLLDQAIKGHQTTWSTFSTSVSTYATSMSTNVQAFTTNSSNSLTTLNNAITKSQTTASNFSTSIATYTKSMTTNVNNFSSAMVSAMDKITKSMDTAKKSADALKKSIDALKDKTITITTRYVTSGSPSGQHGYQGIIGAPGNVGGVKVGEGFRPELITVTPLTKGTGNHYGATMGGGFGSPGGRGGGEVVNNITVVLDGRVIQRFVEKTALAGIGMQI